MTFTDKLKIAAVGNPVVAKRMGKKVLLREDWNEVNVEIMRELVDLKFQDDILAEKLVSTGDSMLIEGNRWHDNYWGACNCDSCAGKEHHNHLGVILMDMREMLKVQG